MIEQIGDETFSFQVMLTPFPEQSLKMVTDFIGTTHYKNRQKEIENRKPEWIINMKAFGNSWRVLDAFSARFISQYNSGKQHLLPEEIVNANYLDELLSTEATLFVNSSEIASLVHFSTSELISDRLQTANMKAKLPPALYAAGTTRIGVSEARGKRQDVYLPEEVRDRHTYIVGKSGTGKSTLVETIALSDIENGLGCAVIDPHGDMVQHILERIPDHRLDDCILFSPKSCPVSLEILTADGEHEIDLLADDLITMFKRTSESWGDKMQVILQMTFQTLLRVPGSSFTDISRLLTDSQYRESILSKINHAQLTNFWKHSYDPRQAEPILIRMYRLTTSGVLRNIFTQHEKSLNFYDVITEGKILLADLSKGFLGESTSHLIGSIIVSQIQLAAMRQAQLPIEQRVPFSLFVDEVQNFTTGAFATILSEARKYKLRLTIAHQFVSQLPVETQKAIFGNVGTMVFFGMSADDLGAARHELGQFEPVDIVNLPKYHALCRPVTAAKDTFLMSTLPLSRTPDDSLVKAVINQTQTEYGREVPETSVEIIPQEINNTEVIEPETSNTVKAKFKERRPAQASPLSFPTNGEKIMHFLRQADYLSQPQIIAVTNLQASNASTALKKLVSAGQIKSLDDRRPKIYSIGKCSPTTHNLLVRDLFVKISNSEFAIKSVNFNKILPGLNPDLTVEFIDENNEAFTTYFEMDRGTEGIAELVSKAERYVSLSPSAQVGFIFGSKSSLELAQKTISNYGQIFFALLGDFQTLNDGAFYRAGDDTTGQFFTG